MIGGGQAGMAAAYYPRRAGSDFVILDAETSPGGSWQHYWDSLHLFSPAEYSSLPGWPMPAWSPGFPPASQVVDYGTAYQSRYDLPVHRPVGVTSVNRSGGGYLVESDHDTWPARAVVNTTGTQLHTISYRSPTPFAGGKVADTLWLTMREPRFRPAPRHLQPLGLRDVDTGRIELDGAHVVGEPGLVFLGYDDWTGPASATLIGVGRTARDAITALDDELFTVRAI